MPKQTTVGAVAKLVAILEPIDKADRIRAVRAALTVLGDDAAEGDDLPELTRPPTSVRSSLREKSYFDQKNPRTKVEELAVAARYREESVSATTHTQAQLREVIAAARRNFDAKNFRRDLENAKVAGLFNRGTGKDSIVLSHYGQSYTDALPDREAVKKLGRPKGTRRRGRTLR